MKATSRESLSSLANDDRAFLLPSCGQRCGQLGAPVEGIVPFPGLDLNELGGEVEPLGCGKPGHRIALGLDAESGSTLAGGGDAIVGNGLLHRDKLCGGLYKTHTTVCVLCVAKYLVKKRNFVSKGMVDH